MVTRPAIAVVMGALCALAACSSLTGPETSRFTREVPWYGHGIWLKADTHIHTRFSDGAHGVDEVVAKAQEFGCDVVAITDHTDGNLRAATPEYFDAIDAARKAHPEMVILAGVEWNFPPWNGEEHATVMVSPAAERRLTEFKQRFDDLGRASHDAALAGDGLRWLADNGTVSGIRPVVIHEHPSRADARSMENVANFKALRQISDLVIGFAGAPGHQGARPIGSYGYREHAIDRWDPVAARVGDAWDTLLGEGLDIWAADAPSDFHTESPAGLHDFWPGEFSETWLYAPTRDAAGVLQAFRAGSFFGDHGRIVRKVEFVITAGGLSRPAMAGEAILVPPQTTIRAEIRVEVPASAWPIGPNRLDRVEIIAIDAAGARVAASGKLEAPDTAFSSSLTVPVGGLALRARGFRDVGDGTRLAFYTNPVRVKTSPE